MLFRGWHFARSFNYQRGTPPMSKAPLRDRPQLPRCLAPPTYLFIDFGNSVKYGEGEKPLYIGKKYGTKFPPEMEPFTLLDTFAVDIWCFGSMIKELKDVSGNNHS